MERCHLSETDLTNAIISGSLTPSIFVKEAVWEMPVDSDGTRMKVTPAIYFSEWMYLVGPRGTDAFDCAFDFYAHEPDALLNDGVVFKKDGNGYVDIRIRLADVMERGAVMLSELMRFENNQSSQADLLNLVSTEVLLKPLGNRERDTLLTIVALVCKEAKLDYTTHAKTARLIKDIADKMGVSIGETTIEGKLKLISDALANHTK